MFPSGCKRELVTVFQYPLSKALHPWVLRPGTMHRFLPITNSRALCHCNLTPQFSTFFFFFNGHHPLEAVTIYHSLWNSAPPNPAGGYHVLIPCQTSTDTLLRNSRSLFKPCIPSTRGAKQEKRGNKGRGCEGLLSPKIV